MSHAAEPFPNVAPFGISRRGNWARGLKTTMSFHTHGTPPVGGAAEEERA
ncbi:hypothetical protein [Lutibaculum baratangense]|uniref:Uncharacterized protein n=1 Tax=Lutibaculum baratangense AMV1 TaxID=631454 RepID=V4RB33_9HYPH|nr:hypothetical protein [Lutibaculum baratangense]ESR22614.1 hypothetical protein N177_3750 [Lutibaculum baratangense AMV1]